MQQPAGESVHGHLGPALTQIHVQSLVESAVAQLDDVAREGCDAVDTVHQAEAEVKRQCIRRVELLFSAGLLPLSLLGCAVAAAAVDSMNRYHGRHYLKNQIHR